MQAQAHYPDPTLADLSPSHSDGEHHHSSHLLYQGATLVAMLLFLVSFWSC
jgi:hypothetical protein